MSEVVITVNLDQATEAVQALRNALVNRRPMHQRIAEDAAEFTKDYLRETGRHATADRLGAKPTGFRAKNAQLVESAFDDEKSYVRMPRRTGLGRAFGEMVILPGAGRTFLTLADSAQTYGKRVGDFPEGTFEFKIVQGRFPALVFKGTDEVGYYLARKVRQKQDRTLLPSDEDYVEVGSRSGMTYLSNLLANEPT